MDPLPIPSFFKPQRNLPKFTLLLTGAILFSALNAVASNSGVEAFKWSVQYLIDNSQKVFGRPQTVWPRHNRGLAISADGQFLYAAYHQSLNGTGEVRKIRLSEPDYVNATVRLLPGHQAKAIAVDDEGRVYIAGRSELCVYDANLSRCELRFDTNEAEGVAVTRENGKLVLYATERDAKALDRWELEMNGRDVVGATPAGLSGSGQLIIGEAKSLRGVGIDSKGRIWFADLDGNKVWRVDNDGKNLKSVEVHTPMAMAFDGAKVFVTRYKDREITIMDLDMEILGTLSIPWEELSLSPSGNNRDGALSGIATVPGAKGFYVANERGQTANQKSMYGRTDDHTDTVDGKKYVDSFMDDNEIILHAVPVEGQE